MDRHGCAPAACPPVSTSVLLADDQEIIRTGAASRALLGVTASTATDDQNREVGTGAQVATVDPGSAAEEAGLLELPVGAPVLRHSRRALLGDKPVEVSRTVYRHDRHTVYVQLSGDP